MHDLITKTLLLKEINPDFAKTISQKWGINEGDVQLIRKGLVPSDFKFADGESSTIDYITTKSVDRDGDIVEPSGANLSDYMKNPVVLWCHDYKQLPLGKNAWIKSDSNGLVAKTIYAVKSNPFAKQVYEYRKDGFPLAKSIGFVPIKLNPTKSLNVKRHFLEYLVLEYSDCPIPSNPDAIGLAVSKGLIKPAQAKFFFYNMEDELIIDGQSIIDDRYLIKSEEKERYNMTEEKKKKDDKEEKPEGEEEIKPPKKEEPKEEEKPEGEEEEKPEGEEEEKPEEEEEEKKPKKKELDDEIEDKAKAVKAKCDDCGEDFIPLDGETTCKMCGGKKKPKKKDLEDDDPTDKAVAVITKPSPDVTENYIRMRQKNPSAFQEDSFRTVTLSEKDGISSVMGRLEGEDAMSIQSYLFDKKKWTVEEATKWVEDHKKKSEKYLNLYWETSSEDMIPWYEDWDDVEEKEFSEQEEVPQKQIDALESEIKSLQEENDDLVSKLDELSYYNQIYEDENNILKEGRVLSGKNASLIQKCITDMTTAISSLQNLLEATSVSKSADEDILEIKEEEDGKQETEKIEKESKTGETKTIDEEEIAKILHSEISKGLEKISSIDVGGMISKGISMRFGKVC